MSPKTARRPDEYVGGQVKRAREDRGWSQTELATRLAALGFTQWRQSKVTKIESGQVKRISLEDTLALAAALGVQPIHLLAPEGALVEIAPDIVRDADEFGLWMAGGAPLIKEDTRTYLFGALVPNAELLRLAALLRNDPDYSSQPGTRAFLDALERQANEGSGEHG